jgi:hypothetical protein
MGNVLSELWENIRRNYGKKSSELWDPTEYKGAFFGLLSEMTPTNHQPPTNKSSYFSTFCPQNYIWGNSRNLIWALSIYNKKGIQCSQQNVKKRGGPGRGIL